MKSRPVPAVAARQLEQSSRLRPTLGIILGSGFEGAVGMSTVPEAIVARQCGMHVAAIACITNLAAGPGKTILSHAEVLETAQESSKLAAQLLQKFAKEYGKGAQ